MGTVDRFDWLELDASTVRDGMAAGPTPLREPHDGPTFLRAARHMRYAGHFKAAARYYERALGFDAQLFDAWVGLVDTLVRARQLDAADAKSIDALETFKQVRALYAARALVLSHQGKDTEAWPLVQVAIEGGSPSWYGHCILGEVYLRMDKRHAGAALDAFDAATRIEANPWEAYFHAGWAWLDQGMATYAAVYFSEAAHLNPRAPLCWLCLGDAFKALRLYDQAQFYYQRVTELEPTNELALDRQRGAAKLLYNLYGFLQRGRMQSLWKARWEKALRKFDQQERNW